MESLVLKITFRRFLQLLMLDLSDVLYWCLSRRLLLDILTGNLKPLALEPGLCWAGAPPLPVHRPLAACVRIRAGEAGAAPVPGWAACRLLRGPIGVWEGRSQPECGVPEGSVYLLGNEYMF